VELYAATPAGLLHFHPGEGAVRRLPTADARAALAGVAAAPELAEAAAVLVLTGIGWRTAWKYGARGWRHVFWDAGRCSRTCWHSARRAGSARAS
jgi:hypothetical protein